MKKLLFFLFLMLSIGLYSQEKRLALVIGNSDYEYGGTLKNPVNDAELMAATLQELGFDVIKKTNANKRQMDAAILDFWRQQADYGVTLFYYAGHGVQVDGINYLVPVDAKLEDELSLRIEGVDMNEVVSQFNRFPKNINIVILDACRDNPFQSWMRGGTMGFAAMLAPSGTLIAFATAPGATASDGKGDNGLFTYYLAEQMKVPQRIEDVFINTRIKVRYASQGRQNPQEWSQLVGQFMFAEPEPVVGSDPMVGAAEGIANYGSIELVTEIAGQLYMDGEEMVQVDENTRVPIEKVIPGKHTLKIVGDETWEGDVMVVRDETATLTAGKTYRYLVNKSSLFQADQGQDNHIILRTGLTDMYGVSGWMADQGYDSLFSSMDVEGMLGLEFLRKWLGIEASWSKRVRFLPDDVSVRSQLLGFSFNGYFLGPVHSVYAAAGYFYEFSSHVTETNGNKDKWLSQGFGYPSLRAGYRNNMLNFLDLKVGAGAKRDVQGGWHLAFEAKLGITLYAF
jgi:hypothetical protein